MMCVLETAVQQKCRSVFTSYAGSPSSHAADKIYHLFAKACSNNVLHSSSYNTIKYSSFLNCGFSNDVCLTEFPA